MKVIETRYKGRKFRSRLEARYAVFFDALRTEWEYEEEGFVLPSGDYYLPDFYLKDFSGGTWVEVKPSAFTKKEKQKCYALCKGTRKNVWLANGRPGFTCYEVYYWSDHPPYVIEGDGVPLADQAEGENRMFAMCGYGEAGGEVRREYLGFMGNTLSEAVRIANEARFEHGETPNI